MADAFGPALASHASSAAPVAAIVGNRVKPLAFRQGVDVPVLLYHVRRARKVQTLDGLVGMIDRVVRFDAYSKLYSTSSDLRRAVRDRFEGHSGEMGVAPNSVRVHAVAVEDEFDAEFSVDDGSGDSYYVCVLDLMFKYNNV